MSMILTLVIKENSVKEASDFSEVSLHEFGQRALRTRLASLLQESAAEAPFLYWCALPMQDGRSNEQIRRKKASIPLKAAARAHTTRLLSLGPMATEDLWER